MAGYNHASTVKHPRVLALLPDAEDKGVSGCSYVRITGPMAYLRTMGYPCDFMTYASARVAASTERGISSYDVFVLPRAGDVNGKTIKLVETLKSAGKMIVWETDDDFTDEHRKVAQGDAMALAKIADAITVSTPHLRTVMQKVVGPDKPIYLLQNGIDFQFWDQVAKQRTMPKPTIGLIGTKTHAADWMLVSDVLHAIAKDFPYVHFAIGGFLPGYLEDLPNLTYFEPVPYIAYPNMVHQVDIGLAPLIADDGFNLCKSAIKAMEYWVSGAAVIASDTPVYQRVAESDRIILASTPRQWYQAIAGLVQDPYRAVEMSQQGRKWVVKHRDMSHLSNFWWDVYTKVHKDGGSDEYF